MARKMTEWPSKRGPITKIMPSDGCKGDTVPLAVGKWYDLHEFGWYMGNVGVNLSNARHTGAAVLHDPGARAVPSMARAMKGAFSVHSPFVISLA